MSRGTMRHGVFAQQLDFRGQAPQWWGAGPVAQDLQRHEGQATARHRDSALSATICLGWGLRTEGPLLVGLPQLLHAQMVNAILSLQLPVPGAAHGFIKRP